MRHFPKTTSRRGMGWRGVLALLTVTACFVSAATVIAQAAPAAPDTPPAPDAKPAEQTPDKVKEAPKIATRTLSGVVRRLGTKAPLAEFHFIVLKPTADGHERIACVTDDKGGYRVAVPSNIDARFFAVGDFVIPASWARVGGGDKDATHDIFVRPLNKATITGSVSVAGKGGVERAIVRVAPLDVLPGGALLPVDVPMMFYSNDKGDYTAQVPAGFYQIWSLWTDMDATDWKGYTALRRVVEVFDDIDIDLELAEGPRISGKVIDAATGEPMEAVLDLYTDAYLRQMSIFTGDGQTESEPLGVFNAQLKGVDPDDFAVVVRSSSTRAAVKIVTGMSREKIAKAGPFKFHDPADGKLDITLVTADKSVPVANIDLSMAPSAVFVPPFLYDSLRVFTYTDDAGRITFWGLPKGKYTAYCMNGDFLLGEVEVTGGPQKTEVKLSIPFIFGSLTYPDGTKCAKAEALVVVEFADGSTTHPLRFDAFMVKKLAGEGQYFVPFRWDEVTYHVTFGAPDAGKDMPEGADAEDLPWFADGITIKPAKGELKGIEKNITLKKREPPKEDDKKDDGKEEDKKEEDKKEGK